MATNSDHPSSSAAFEAINEKSEKAIFGPGKVKEKGTSDEAQLSKDEDSGNQGSTVEKYPKLGDMTEDEQDAYFAEGLDSEEVRKLQEDNKISGSNAMLSIEGGAVHLEGVGFGLSDQNSASSSVEAPKGFLRCPLRRI